MRFWLTWSALLITCAECCRRTFLGPQRMEHDRSQIAALRAFLARHPDQWRRHREESLRLAIVNAGRKGGPRGR